MKSPKDEAQELVDELLPFAKRMLAQHGEFHPYGGYMRADTSIVHAGAIDQATDHPRATDLVTSLRNDFSRRARREGIRAAALVLDVRVTPPNQAEKADAIQVILEHRDSYCAEVFFPYVISDDGSLTFGMPFAQRGEHTIF
jgi:hypothetical protein